MRRVQEVIADDGSVVRRKPQAGDLRWDGRVWLRWSGRSWSPAAYSLEPARLRDPERLHDRPRIEQSRRQRALFLAVEDQVLSNAATVVFDGPSGVVLAYSRPISHWLHAFLTVITAGLWLAVWLAVVFTRRDDRIRLEPDPWGNVWVRPVASSS